MPSPYRPLRQAQVIDLVITDTETSGEDGGEKISWNCEIVGAPEEVPYVQLEGIAPEVNEITLAVNETRTIAVSFTPETASNRRYTAASENAHYVRVGAADEDGFTLTGVMKTEAPVPVRIRSMNNGLTASVAVSVN